MSGAKEEDRSFPNTLLWINGLWTVAWFGITVWLATVADAYVTVAVSLLFQLFSMTALLMYNKKNPALFFAFLAPVLFNVATIVRLYKLTDSTTCPSCWQALLGLNITGIALSALALFWYLWATESTRWPVCQ
jgi:hypothetical protein